MNNSEWISLIAILVSALSALYARRSVNEARKANRISLQFEKVDIYKEVISYSDCFRGLFSVPTAQRLEQFKKQAVELSEIYFSQGIHSQLREVYSHCSNCEMYLSVVQDNSDDRNEFPSEHEIRSDYKAVLEKLYPVIEQMKNELKINV